MSDHVSNYLSYLLRLWRVDEDGRQVWRASLEDPRTGERRGFTSLGQLMEFLLFQIKAGDEEERISRS